MKFVEKISSYLMPIYKLKRLGIFYYIYIIENPQIRRIKEPHPKGSL